MGDLAPDLGFFDLDLFVITNLIGATCLYLWAARRTPGWSRMPTASFLSAMVALALAYLGPFGAWAHDAFWAHMGQHLLLVHMVVLLVEFKKFRIEFIETIIE